MLAAARSLADARRGLRETLWSALAYAGRYGSQPVGDALGMTLADLFALNRAVADIVKDENKPRR